MKLFKSKNEKDAKVSLKKASDIKTDLGKYRKQFESFWKECEDAYHGQIWKNSDGYRPYENNIFEIIESEVPILTDSIPSSSVRIDDPNKIEQGKVLNKSLEFVYKNQSFPIKYPMLVRASLISAPSYMHVYYDANANNGQGEIKHEIIDWRQVMLDGKPLFIEECEKARLELTRSKEYLKMAYMSYAEEIEKLKGQDLEDTDSNSASRETQDTGGGYSQRRAPSKYVDTDTLKLIKTYIKSYETEKIPEEVTQEEFQSEAEELASGGSPDVSKWQDHKAHIEQHKAEIMQMLQSFGVSTPEELEVLSAQLEPEEAQPVMDTFFKVNLLIMHIEAHNELGKENPKGHRLKYPNGMREIHTINDKVVVYDGKALCDHAEIPLAPFYCYRNGTIYGEGEVRNIIDSQRMKAIMEFKEYKQLQRVANPNVIIDKESGLTKDDYSNEDGGVYVLPQGANIRQMEAGRASEQLPRFADRRFKSIQEISGVNEATQGELMHPNQSGVSVDKVQQQAIGRIRLKDRQFQYYSIKRVAFLTTSEIIQNWTEEKLLEVNNDQGDIQEIIFNPLDVQDLKWNIELDSSSMAGVDKDAYTAMLRNDVMNGHLTYDQFLKIAPIPNKEKLIELREESNEQQQQMQEMQAQGEELSANLEAVQMENIRLKGEAEAGGEIELLSADERKVYEDMKRQENIQAITGVINDQPEQGAI